MTKFNVLLLLCAPLVGAIFAGIFGKLFHRRVSHLVTIAGVAISFLCALRLAAYMLQHTDTLIQANIYEWASSGNIHFYLGYYLDSLTAIMAVVVTFVSLLVHIYSIGYMHDDAGDRRFFAYMSLFTFAMLLLVVANNCLQLFIGWEGVGLVSYLLIGFWFQKDSAAVGSFKAFIVNRVGDFGFILGIAALLNVTDSLSYTTIFAHATSLASSTITLFPNHSYSMLTVSCILLFVGAMGKSAQIPLHVWLPESMEGPTPISALIHAATMVTAGVFMIARFSPLFSLSPVALSVVLIFGATGALFLGLLAIVEFDIKRIIAYSTMSQLGYMMAANGAGAYPLAIFHLMTHACFKALLFLAAGSIIMAVHHEQDIRKMGGLRKRLPWTYICFLVGGLALAAIPPFAGFYSKDLIIEAVQASSIPGAHYAYLCLVLGAFVTAFYTFRAFFLTFHGNTRMNPEEFAHVHENGLVIIVPLVLLAIPSLALGWFATYPMLYAPANWLHSAITLVPNSNLMTELASAFHSPVGMIGHAFKTPAFYLSVIGIILPWYLYVLRPGSAESIAKRFQAIVRILTAGYGFNKFNDIVFVQSTTKMSNVFYKQIDMRLIDHYVVNGSGRYITALSSALRRMQTGYLYHYIFVMLLGLIAFLWYLVV
jgi:NADH-quinone oxidoreductase subunit L